MQKRWVVAEPTPDIVRSALNDLDEVTTQLLYNRGITDMESAAVFFDPRYDDHIHDPYLFDDMPVAVARIIRAIREGEKIVIYGDYDVDGICASTVLRDTLLLLGAVIEVYLPHREKEGYGLKIPAIESLAEQGARLIITNDCGISNRVEVAHAVTLGMDVIITDHHHPPEHPEDLPPALAIIHPQVHADRYPYKYLAGVGSAFKLVQGIIRSDFDEWFNDYRAGITNEKGEVVNWEAYEKWLLDVVSVATVTDCMPLTGENRAIVMYGLKVLNKTRRVGLKALLANARRGAQDFDTQTIGFFIGPRINAASRMDHAFSAFKLMISETLEEAANHAMVLEQTNADRQELSARITDEADLAIQEAFISGKPILVALGESWPIGVLGLVAGRIMNKYHRPVILATSANGHIDGTARSIPSFNVAECLSAHADYLARFGGHAAAGGFAMKEDADFSAFKSALESYGHNHLDEEKLTPRLSVDMEIDVADITWELWETVQRFEPCGQANPRPNFLLRNLEIVEARGVGNDASHLKLALMQSGRIIKGIGFSLGEWAGKLSTNSRIDVVAELSVNEWNGNRNLEIMVTDIALADADTV